MTAGPQGPEDVSSTPDFRLTQVIGERLRNMPKVTIAKVEDHARGGGNEIVIAADMAFAARGAIFGQPEIMVGLVPCGGSTQRLPALIGRSRAIEVFLGGEDFLLRRQNNGDGSIELWMQRSWAFLSKHWLAALRHSQRIP